MSADHQLISEVLHSLWDEYAKLSTNIDEFRPRTREEFEPDCQARIARLSALNPHMAPAELAEMARGFVVFSDSEQIVVKFQRPTERLLIKAVFMSQALCEALINQVLMLGLHEAGISDRFAEWERKGVEEKWVKGPKEFAPGYKFDKSGQLYQTLRELVRKRNNYMHYKPVIEIEGKTIYGQWPPRHSLTFKDVLNQIHRFISLPYDLCMLCSIALNDVSYQILLNRENVAVPAAHERDLNRIASLPAV